MSRRLVAMRIVEFAGLYGALPVVFGVVRVGIIPGLILGCAILLFVLWRDPTFERRRFVNIAGAKRELRFMLSTFALGAIGLIGLTWWLSTWLQFQGRIGLFGFPRRNPAFYAIVMTAYPIFSVYPQELIYRTFFFHRYACVFRHPAMMIFASAAAFGWAHHLFDNPRIAWDAELSVALTFVGGLLMAWTYHRSRSTAAAWLEHSLFGDWVWTIGLGSLFYAGASRVVAG